MRPDIIDLMLSDLGIEDPKVRDKIREGTLVALKEDGCEEEEL